MLLRIIIRMVMMMMIIMMTKMAMTMMADNNDDKRNSNYKTLQNIFSITFTTTKFSNFALFLTHDDDDLVWFDFCFMALQHILGHFGRSQLP